MAWSMPTPRTCWQPCPWHWPWWSCASPLRGECPLWLVLQCWPMLQLLCGFVLALNQIAPSSTPPPAAATHTPLGSEGWFIGTLAAALVWLCSLFRTQVGTWRVCAHFAGQGQVGRGQSVSEQRNSCPTTPPLPLPPPPSLRGCSFYHLPSYHPL